MMKIQNPMMSTNGSRNVSALVHHGEPGLLETTVTVGYLASSWVSCVVSG